MAIPYITAMLPVVGQVAGALAGMASLALIPPSRGPVLLVSIVGQPVADIANAAIISGARIARQGPGNHSLIVVGERARLIGLMRLGLIPLDTPAILCGP